MKIGIVLATRIDLVHVVALARAARHAIHEVRMFAMDAGCNALAEHAELAQQLLDDDVEITACSNSSVDLELTDGIERGSQDDHAAVITTSDRVVAFT